MKHKVALIVGHYGPGTGCSTTGRDEWTLAQKDVELLYSELLREQLIQPLMFYIDRRELRWSILGDLLTTRNQIFIKSNWASAVQAAVAIEFHYNSAIRIAEGNLIVAPMMSHFAQRMDRALTTLPNRHRDPIINSRFYLFQFMQDMPTIILEPAFIFEDAIDNDAWRPMLVAAVKHGIYDYFGLEARG